MSKEAENEENYEYCVPSTILCYKTLYNNERIVREEKEKELKEYDDLFKVYQKQEEEKQDEIIIKDQSTFEEILAEFDKIVDPELVINPEISENYKNPGYPTQKKTEIEMSTLNKIKIIEYTTTVLYDKKTKKIWVSKRTNPDKEFYEHWQSPGGHVEESDISTKWAARRENRPLLQSGNKRNTKLNGTTRNDTLGIKEILKGPMIDSLKDIIRYPKENETKIIIIEGSCGAGKSTLAKKCKEYYKKQGLLTTLIDESFITQDPEQKLKKYAENLEKYRKNEITKEQMELLAIEWEKEIRDKWMSQIYFQVTNNLTGMKPDIIIMDRDLWSTIIFMKNMIKEGFFTEESLVKITENYKYWRFFTREALVIWWNTPTEEIIKRLIKRNRGGEGDLEYFRNLIKTYKEYMPEIYQNIKIINRETLVTVEELDELLPEILNEKRIRN
ncbi:hypothetical protein Glove_21g240 [Diversispora epigaea]|uniref:Deoxynucleoside kinase domain-containing protein n=1 Tax=Diversispora epigaea TaxID=1348612 RepID=A0A397JTW6_9GLOM|nr:hypothetical protein Glove_21g240 [Diversispora epigaea]